eukprot:6272137-Ditylum_brightwellii.AAC.1
MNLVKNNEVTTEDVNLGLKAYGPDVGEVKAKTTRRHPDPVQDRTNKIPDELLKVNEEVVLSIDGLVVNTIDFLTSISHDIYYCTAQCVLNGRTAKEYIKLIDKLVVTYKKG